VKTGEYRRNRQGILEPAYVTREIYEPVKMNCRIRGVASQGPNVDCCSARGPIPAEEHTAPQLRDKLGRKILAPRAFDEISSRDARIAYEWNPIGMQRPSDDRP
jgi:hypothetical protein